jgi:hypothetical protein
LEKDDKNWRILILIIIGGLILYKLYKSFQSDLLFDFFIYLFLGFIGFVNYAWTIYKDYTSYLKSRSLTSFIPSLIGFLLIMSIIGLQELKNHKMNASSLMQAYYNGDLSGIDIDLKKDGSYIISNGNWGGMDYFYGKYSIQDSIIRLDKPNIDKVINSNTLVIRKSTKIVQQDIIQGNDTIFVDKIFQIDKYGKDIKTEIIFQVIRDNRKTILNNKSTFN